MSGKEIAVTFYIDGGNITAGSAVIGEDGSITGKIDKGKMPVGAVEALVIRYDRVELLKNPAR